MFNTEAKYLPNDLNSLDLNAKICHVSELHSWEKKFLKGCLLLYFSYKILCCISIDPCTLLKTGVIKQPYSMRLEGCRHAVIHTTIKGFSQRDKPKNM